MDEPCAPVVGDDADVMDVRPDGQVCPGWTFSPTNFDCLNPPGTNGGNISLGGTFDTTAGTLDGNTLGEVLVNDANVWLVRGTTITVPFGGLTVTGTRALMVIGDSITVEDEIKLATSTTQPGPGSDVAGHCGPATAAHAAPSSSSGGGGGGYGEAGASGAAATSGLAGTGRGTAGNALISPLRGGCPGGYGGRMAGTTDSQEGYGGGAIQLVAKNTIHLQANGKIRANGGQGQAGVPRTGMAGGGGGGGSGGAILLEANMVILDATTALCANGGAGGSGSNTTMDGSAGQDAFCTAMPAFGGAGPNGSGTGGNGGAEGYPVTATPPTASAGSSGSGGGGGGGVGRIRINTNAANPPSISASAFVSPAATN